MADSYLSRFGETLVRNGYAVIPIMPGTKHPPVWMNDKRGDSWSKVEPSIERVREWNRDKRLAGAGLGVNLGRSNATVDLDILNPEIAASMASWCDEHLAFGAPVRIGLAPKRLMVFRVDDPIRTTKSKVYFDAEGRKCQVEILGLGNQFVAYAIHPDTGKPYSWPDGDLVDTPRANLPLLTLADAKAVIAEFEKQAQEMGLKAAGQGTSVSTVDADDWTDTIDNGKTDLTLDQLKDYVKAIRNGGLDDSDQDFDTWLQVGMAVYHQTDGSDEGFQIWCDWSALSTKHVRAECERRWRSFDVSAKDRKPITARWLIKVVNEQRDEKVKAVVEDIRGAIEAATTEDALRAAAKRAKRIELDKIERDFLASTLQRRLKAVTGASIPIGVVRDMLRYEQIGTPEPPGWLATWVFISSENVFFDRTSGVALKPEAFDAAHARLFLTMMDRKEGRAAPEKRPSDLALNVYQIPVVARRVYLPSEDPAAVVEMGGMAAVNTYSKVDVPEVPNVLSAQEKADLALIQRHLEWMIPDPRELHLLLSHHSHVAKSGRVRWAIVLHGTAEGAGKTFLFDMMCHVLGRQNARMVAPKELEREFTGWAEGVQFICLEEIKLHGHNRYDIMNSLKPLITNDFVSVRRMRTDSYMAPNTASYLALTNFADALPISDQDRRYMMISTAPTTADLLALPKDYFKNLFTALERSAGAVRGWLRNITPHPEFQANGRAPATEWKKQAAALAESEEVSLIRDMMNEGRTGMTRRLLSTRVLAEALMDAGESVPATRSLNRALMDVGMAFLGRVKIGGVVSRVWAEDPREWRRPDGSIDTDRIREWLSDDL